MDEYRFEVKLNTDRMIHYVVANTALLSVGTGLLKVEGAQVMNCLVALVFVIGALTAHLGNRAIRKGHEYYHRTVLKKTVIEDLLGLTALLSEYPGATLSIGTTIGQADVSRMLQDPEAWLARSEPKRGSVVHAAVLVLRLLLFMDIVGAIAALAQAWHSLPYIPWP